MKSPPLPVLPYAAGEQLRLICAPPGDKARHVVEFLSQTPPSKKKKASTTTIPLINAALIRYNEMEVSQSTSQIFNLLHDLAGLKAFLEKNPTANVNPKGSKYGYTPLFYAARCGYVDVVKFLIDRGADINTTDNRKKCPCLVLAERHGHPGVIIALLDARCDINARDACGSTALMEACCRSCLRVVEVLLERGADINAHNERGFTALMEATYNGINGLKILHRLVDRHVDLFRVNGDNEDGETALDMSRSWKCRSFLNTAMSTELQMTTKLAANQIHSDAAKMNRILNRTLNELSPGEIAFFVLDRFKNCGWYGQAERVVELVGLKAIVKSTNEKKEEEEASIELVD